MSDKPILSLMQRRQLEQAVIDLGKANSEAALISVARQIVHTYPAEQVLSVLLKQIDTNLSQLRGGLAHVAALLPTEQTIPALRAYAANRSNPPHGRFTAAQIMDHYLGEPVPAGVLADLQGNDDAAFQSLLEAVEEGRRNRYVLYEYVTQMQEHGEDIAFLVLNALERLPGEDRVELLRLVAQDERRNVGQAALRGLDQLAAAGDLPSAVRALHTVRFTLPATQAEPIERALRKLQMRNKGHHTPPQTGWRALISPAEPSGSQSVWLLRMPQADSERAVLVSVVTNLQFGAAGFYASEELDRLFLPGEKPVGELVRVQTESGPAIFIEAPLAYGLWLVQSALRLHSEGKARFSLGSEYKLYNDLVWQFAPVALPAELQPYFAATEISGEIDYGRVQEDCDLLTPHMAMSSWQLAPAPVATPLHRQRAVRTPAVPPDPQMATQILREIESIPEREQFLSALAIGLRKQAAWLHLANDQTTAQAALRLANVLPLLAALENPLLRWMVERGIGGGRGEG